MHKKQIKSKLFIDSLAKINIWIFYYHSIELCADFPSFILSINVWVDIPNKYSTKHNLLFLRSAKLF